MLVRAEQPLDAEPFIDEGQAYRDQLPLADKSLAAETDFQIGILRLQALRGLGQYDEARKLGAALLREFRRDESPYYDYVINVYLVDAYLATGSPAEAEAAARSTLHYALRSGGTVDDQSLHYAALSHALLARGDARQALAVTDPQRENGTATSNPDMADFYLARGRALLALGQAAEARGPLQRAYEFGVRFAPGPHRSDIARYWYAQALREVGAADAAQALNAGAAAPPDFPAPDIAGLKAERRRPVAERIAAVLRKYPLRPEIAPLVSAAAIQPPTR